ncbi:minor tail protein [Streptomyces phage Annadreamy]|uniref:Minor tail protein n=2 Tax=Annadreamyvirus annadreamy TaxID=2846392 RepID=A0A345GT89_9CAUD|nr:tail protein [Streptomyces phage Annadreamy]AXG66161.1 minor tail protein [Streptomyces phage Annadreamy]QGH79373.1 minor tail protein [Streptomyces phage Limpid]
MKGVYRFYQGGELIAEHKNLLTTEGKRLILRYLAGQSPSLGAAIGLGVSGAAATVDDTTLGFEIERVSVALKSADYTNSLVLFKGTVEQDTTFNIYEAGLWSSSSNTLSGEFDSKLLTTFDLSLEEWTNVTADTTANRTSEDSAKVSAAISSTTQARLDVEMDLSGYSVNDTFLLAFSKPNNNITTIKLVFEDPITGGSLSLSKTVSALPTGYNILTFKKGDFVASGTINWDNITRMGFDVTAGGTAGYVILDGLRVEDVDTPNQDYILVSHAILSSPINKTNVAPMDVEYALEFSV